MPAVNDARRQIRRSGRRVAMLVRVVLALLVAVPILILVRYGIDDWDHVGPDSVQGISTSSYCRELDGMVEECFGDFRSDSGDLVLHDVSLRGEVTADGHRDVATAARDGGHWVALGTSHYRIAGLLFGQITGVGMVWILVYAGTIGALLVFLVMWTGMQVGRAFEAAGPGAKLTPEATQALRENLQRLQEGGWQELAERAREMREARGSAPTRDAGDAGPTREARDAERPAAADDARPRRSGPPDLGPPPPWD